MGHPDQSEKLMTNVHESEQPDTPFQTAPPKKRRLSDKLGFINLLILVLGTVVVFIALGILLFTWIVSLNSDDTNIIPPSFWSLFVKRNWTSRVVTLSSTVIRIATAAQLGIFTAIVAALILEKVGAPRSDFPKLSIMRCSNSGPNSLALTILGSMFTLRLLPYTILIVLAIVDAFAVQFTSTILLTDFGYGSIIFGKNNTNIKFGIHSLETANASQDLSLSNPYTGVDYYLSAPATYSRFAEYSEPGFEAPNSVDTGTTLRAFLPFANATDRNRLRNYEGPMTVADTRVVCVKPTVSNITFDSGSGLLNTAPATFMAMYDWSDTHPNISGAAQFDNPVNCTIPVKDYFKPGQWASSLCSYPFDDLSPARLNGIIPDLGPENGNTTLHLFINATGSSTDWSDLQSAGATLDPVLSSTGPWARLQKDNVSISVSLCFFNPNPSQYKVTADSEYDGWDTAVQWNASSNSYNTSDVQYMLNAANFSHSTDVRGLLTLHNSANWTAVEDVVIYKENSDPFTWFSLERVPRYSSGDYPDVAQTALFTELSTYGDGVHRTLATIVQNTIKDTLNPAITIQAFWTILMQQAYYDFVPEFELSAQVTFEQSSSVRIPVQWSAFAVVIGLIGVHFALILVALLLFLRTDMSLLGNSWQAVSQVVSTDTADIVHHAATSTDKELLESAKASGIDNDMIRIAKCENSGRVQARAVRTLSDKA